MIFGLSFYLYCLFVKSIPVFKLFVLGLLPLTFIFSWKFYCFKFNIANDLTNSDLLSQMTNRILSWTDVKLIFDYLFFQEWVAVVSIMLLLVFLNRAQFFKFTILFSVFFIFAYSFALFFVYLSTPQDLSWHLRTSASRVVMPLNILSVAVFLYVINAIYANKIVVFLNSKISSSHANR